MLYNKHINKPVDLFLAKAAVEAEEQDATKDAVAFEEVKYCFLVE